MSGSSGSSWAIGGSDSVSLSIGNGLVWHPTEYGYYPDRNVQIMDLTIGNPNNAFVISRASTKTNVEDSDVKTEQQMIDEAVQEAVSKPRREAEVAKRLEAIEKIGAVDYHNEGATLRWKRKVGEETHTFVAVKTGPNQWLVAGTKLVKSEGWTWESLVKWMIQGENIVFDLMVANSWQIVL